MTASRSYGDVIAHSLGIGGAPALKTRGLLASQISVSRISVGRDQLGMSPRIPAEDTFILAHYLTDVPHHELWSRDRPVIAQGYEAGSVRVVNLAEEYAARLTHTHEAMAFYIPRAALDEMAEQSGGPRVAALQVAPGVVDPVLRHLSASLLPSLARPGEASLLFVDHVVGAIASHLIRHYGGLEGRAGSPFKGGLSPFHAERAKEFLAAHCERDVSLFEVASHCGLSRGHFVKAFRTTVGTTPHRWRQRYRIDKAKDMLSGGDTSIADIALACGFADQSHFTRIFSRMTGDGPATWRRRQREK